MNSCERLKAKLRLLPLITKMDPLLHSQDGSSLGLQSRGLFFVTGCCPVI
ncbi:UNVERIFIED_CONTAM: hypothetical protein FKN15_030458 [Acipenser sinensis]